MSSSNKTDNLRLNSWTGGDVPCRTDFVSDNEIIDTALGTHRTNGTIHITQSEREKWNAPYYIGTYMGNGNQTRLINYNAGFVPKWGILFAVSVCPSVNDYTNRADYNYFAILSERGSTPGVTLANGSITVTQSTIPVSSTEYKSYNESGITYIYILFR